MSESSVPKNIAIALERAAKKLGEALVTLRYPNGGKDAVFAEANLLVYVAHGLLSCEPPYLCYAEAAHTNSRRIDMIAFDGACAIAIEAKTLGDVEYAARYALDDLKRLKEFRPMQNPGPDGLPVAEWWGVAKERWGLILIGSHGGNNVKDAWESQSNDAAALILHDRGSSSKITKGKAKLLELLREIDALPDAKRGAENICSGKNWKNCQDAYLLWAAFCLNASDS